MSRRKKMSKPLDQLSDLALEVFALSSAARSCNDYETGLRLACQLRTIGERLVKLSPALMDAMTDGVLQRLMERKFPEVLE